MTDIFSTEFLTNLKQQLKSKTKPSKALLDAIKDITLANNTYKKKISQLQSQINSLKQQNQILKQFLESTKQDMQNRIKLKDKKIQNWIQNEAKLHSQNQILKNQLQRIRQQLKIYKNVIQSSRIIAQPANQQKLTKSQHQYLLYNNQNIQKNKYKQLTHLIQINSQYDLNSYLFSQKQKTQRQSIQDILQNNQKNKDISQFDIGTRIQISKQNEQIGSINHIGQKIKISRIKDNMYKSQCMMSQNSIQVQVDDKKQ